MENLRFVGIYMSDDGVREQRQPKINFFKAKHVRLSENLQNSDWERELGDSTF